MKAHMSKAKPFWSSWLWLVWPLGILPIAILFYQGATGSLGPDPAKELVEELGYWGFVLLCVCLSVRPLVMMTGASYLFPLRRHLGLLAFSWLSLHFVSWAVLLLGLDFEFLAEEIVKRPYILVGLTGWLLMVPLALTSTKTSRRKLGRRWLKLHRLVYISALLGLLHMFWIEKFGIRETLPFVLALVFLFAWRWKNSQKKVKKPV